jgi:predicted O-linked N-acetylglucosamine transferase (SPINDLY family)
MTFCIGIACVRNEADVVEMWARYNLQLIDELHVVDNLSVDRTRWVLEQLQAEGLALHIHVCDDPSYQQAFMMNRVARAAAARPGVDFVVPLDADELLAVPHRAALHAALAAIPPGCAGAMTWRTYLPAPAPEADASQPFFRRMTSYRSLENRSLNKLVLPAALCAEYGWSVGSHNAFHDQTRQQVSRADLPFRLAHFPVRDADQLARKVLVGAQAVLRDPQRGARQSWHWLDLAQQLREADASGQRLDLQRIALTYSLGDEVLAQQQIVAGGVPDFPQLQQRYPVPTMSKSEVLELLKAAQPQHAVGSLWRQVGTAPALAGPWLALARAYEAQGLPWQAGYSARQALRLDPGLLAELQALAPDGWRDAAAGDALLGRAELPGADDLAQRFAVWLGQEPGDWLSALYLARLREMSGGAVDAGVTAQACALEPINGESLHWLGVWRLNAGEAQGAVTALAGLLDIRPLRHGSMMFLGEALLRIGNAPAAEKAFARAGQSSNPDFLRTLAARVYRHNYWQEAIELLNKALATRPGSVDALLALAKMQSEVYALADCRSTLERVQALDPGNAEARLLRAGLQGRVGDAAGHLATLQAAYAAGGDPLSRLASSIAMTALYQDDLLPAEVAELHRRLCAPIEAAVQQRRDFAHLSQPNLPNLSNPPTRPLRIGLVTGDLHRQHPVNIFMLPVLLRLDPARVEVCIYHTGTMHDEYTRQAQGCAARWVEAAALDDAALQSSIVADGVQVLIDLGGHTSTHRLGVFALRAAPVQATFLGYPHSTGLSAIDWLIGDAVVSPAAHGSLFSEGIAQLPGSVFCWAPVDNYPLPSARAPDAPLRFGSFNNAMKLTPRTVALWARVLHAVPGSQLLLKAPSLKDAEVRARFAGLFAAQGIAAERLELRGPSGLGQMMQEYGEIDIGLDPAPYNGGTTTLQALWMGVPVVALMGGNFVSRMGASFMHTLGQPGWVAADEAGYVAAAVALAGDRAALRQGRAALRAQMLASPLCDIDRYVLDFEALLQRMWRQHCHGGGSRLLAAETARVEARPTAVFSDPDPVGRVVTRGLP